MADNAFTADASMPGLSGRDLRRRVLAPFGSGVGSGVGAGGTASDSRRETALRSLAGLDRRSLRDIGLDRGAA